MKLFYRCILYTLNDICYQIVKNYLEAEKYSRQQFEKDFTLNWLIRFCEFSGDYLVNIFNCKV